MIIRDFYNTETQTEKIDGQKREKHRKERNTEQKDRQIRKTDRKERKDREERRAEKQDRREKQKEKRDRYLVQFSSVSIFRETKHVNTNNISHAITKKLAK